MSLNKKNSLGNRILIGVVFFFLYAPILLLIFYSFNAADSSVVWKGFSLRWYAKLFQNQLIIKSVYNTLLVSVLATLIATVVGTLSAIGLYSMRRKFREPLLTINNIPMMNADIVTGVAMCLFFVAALSGWNYLASHYRLIIDLFGTQYRVTFHQLSLGFGTLLIAHITFNIPYVILSVAPKLRQMDKNLVDAAQDLIYSMTKKGVTPEINAVSTILFGVVLVLLIIVNVREIRAEKAAAKRVY